MSDGIVLPGYALAQPRNSSPEPGQWELVTPAQKQPNPTRTGGWELVSRAGQPVAKPEARPGFGDLLKSGVAQVGQAASGLLEAFGPTDELQQTGQQWREQTTKAMVAPMTLEQMGVGYDKLDWTSPVEVTKWLGSTLANTPRFVEENVVSQLPNMGVSGAAAYGGAALGGLFGGPVGASVGLAAGTYAASYFLNAGETFAGLREKGVSRDAAAETAGFVGAAKGVLDTVLPAKLFGSLATKLGMKVFWVPKDSLDKAPALAKALFAGAGIEGGTEAGQELLDMWAEQAHGVYTPGQGVSRVLNSAAAGAAGGGVFSGAAYATERLASRSIEEQSHVTELDEEAATVAPAGTVPVEPPAVPKELTPDQVPGAVRDRFLGLGGQEALFKTYTGDEIKKVLEIGDDLGLKDATRFGLLTPVGEGFQLSEKVTGAVPMEPVPDIPGMYKAVDNALLTYQYIPQDQSGKVYKIDFVPMDPTLGTDDSFKTVQNGQVLEARTLEELGSKIDESAPVTAPVVQSAVTPPQPAEPTSPHTPEQLETITRLFPTATVEQQDDSSLLIKGANGIVMRKAPNGTIVVETPPARGSQTETRLGEPGSIVTGVTRTLTPQYAAYLGGLRGTEVQVDPALGADRETLIHEFGWHTFLELGATPEQRERAKVLFKDEETGATAMAAYLNGTWNARDQAKSKFLFDVTEWFKNLYYQLMGKPQALFNEAGRGDWVNNTPAPARTLGEQYEIRRQENLAKANTFFSQLERVVETKVPKVAPASQIVGILTNPQNGVKAEELRWSEIIDWLKERGMNKVTQEELWAKVRENEVSITEVEKSDRAKNFGGWINPEGAPKFSSWQVPGGAAYQELLMTLPKKELGPWIVRDYDTGEAIRTFNNPADADEFRQAVGGVVDSDTADTYESPHWDERNVLAHTRFNSREINGKNILFVEEIQSDWHQAGRKGGYAARDGSTKIQLDNEFSAVARELESLRNTRSHTHAQNERFNILLNRERELWDLRNKAASTPDAPFHNSWHELVFKRLLRYAAENGYDQIAWTDGATQAERYDLSKQVSSITYDPESKYLDARDLNGTLVFHRLSEPQELDRVIGKELGEKLLATPLPEGFRAQRIHKLSGLDLKVGGEGMKGFYDKILVDFANKYGKKWNARVSDAWISKTTDEYFVSYEYDAFTGTHFDVIPRGEFQPVQSFVTIEEVEKFILNETGLVRTHAMPITAAMKQSVLYEGQPMFERRDGSPTPVPASDNQGSAEMKRVNKLIRHLPADSKIKVQDAYGRFYKVLRHGLFLTQLQDQNPNNLEVKQYVDLARLRKMIQNKVQLVADSVSRIWMKAGRKNLNRISDLLRQVNEESERKGRRLALLEVREIAAKLGGPTDKIVEAWKAVDDSLVKGLDILEAALTDEAKRSLGPIASPFAVAKIQEQIDRLRHVNYFPATRFGDWGVLVKAKDNFYYKGHLYGKGQTIMFETREVESASLSLRDELTKELPSDKVDVLLRKLTPTEHSFINMPEALAEYLKKHLELTEDQFEDLKHIQYNLAPGRGLVKHMIRKQGILGASVDGLRVYNDYFQKLSGHVAKIATSSQIENVIAQAKAKARGQQADYSAQLTAETLEQNYRDMQDAGNEWGAVAGGIFHLVFGFNPLSAVVNLSQLPVFTYPYLAKNSNDLIATKAMAVATKKVGGTLKAITTGDAAAANSIYIGEDKVFFDRAVDEGFLNESLSGEIAALASGSMLTKYYEGGVQAAAQMRWLLSKSIIFFKVAEEFNRRVTFQSALEVGRAKGLTEDNLYQFARTAVDLTQFEYSRWNRPKMMRGKASILFIFKAYLQNFLYFAATNQGGMRFWLMLVALAGLKGVPGSDDLLDMVELLGTWGKQFFGLKNPKVDAEKMAREFILWVGGNPDLVMNGFSRYSYGATGIASLFGLPFPAADFSTSMQMTRLIPGMRMVKGMSQGTMRWPDAFLTAAQDVLGVAGSTGMNITRGILEDSPYAGSRLANIPSFSKNLSRAVDMATKGAYRDPDGATLVDVDLTKPEHVGEIIMQALGKRPTRVAAKLESRYMDNEKIAYYLARREIIITHWANAIGSQDKEATQEARKEYVKFSKTAPPEFVIPPSQLRGELHKLLNKRGLKEMGLASNKKFIKMAQDTATLYNSPF